MVYIALVASILVPDPTLHRGITPCLVYLAQILHKSARIESHLLWQVKSGRMQADVNRRYPFLGPKKPEEVSGDGKMKQN